MTFNCGIVEIAIHGTVAYFSVFDKWTKHTVRNCVKINIYMAAICMYFDSTSLTLFVFKFLKRIGVE